MKNSLTYSLSMYYILTNLAPYQVSKALKLLYKKSLLHYILVIVASLMWTLFFGPGVLCPLSFKTSSMNPPQGRKSINTECIKLYENYRSFPGLFYQITRSTDPGMELKLISHKTFFLKEDFPILTFHSMYFMFWSKMLINTKPTTIKYHSWIPKN